MTTNRVKSLLFLVFLSLILNTKSQTNFKTIICKEDFESGQMPAGWSQITKSIDGGWHIGTANSLLFDSYVTDHTKFIATNDYHCNCDKSNDMIITKSFDLSNYSKVYLFMDVYFWQLQNQKGDSIETATIYLSTDSGSTFNKLTTDSIWGSKYSGWNNQFFDLSKYAGAGYTNVKIGIKYNDDGLWALGLALDNFTLVEPYSNDAQLDMLDIHNLSSVNKTDTIEGFFTNNSSSTIKTLELNWSVDNGTVYSGSVNNLNLNPFYSGYFKHPVTWTANTPGIHSLQVWVKSVNNQPDQYSGNDTLKMNIKVIANKPEKKTLIEEFTGAWCGYCPFGAATLNDILAKNKNTIGVAIHVYERYGGLEFMNTDEGKYLCDSVFNKDVFFPTGMIDRYLFPGENSNITTASTWKYYSDKSLNYTVPASVSSENSYNKNTREISVNVNAKFFNDDKGPFNVNCYITEDSIKADEIGYYQYNYYTDPQDTPYYGPIKLVDYYHMHVLKNMLGGPWGIKIADSVKDGDQFSKQFTYTLPKSYNEKNINLIVMVQRFGTDTFHNREILNSEIYKLSDIISGVNTISNSTNNEIQLYPNPAKDLVNLVYRNNEKKAADIKIFNIFGQEVYREITNASETINKQIDISNFSKGVYFIRINSGNQTINKKFIVE
ncbi:MAG: Omp28-related outer membrane protein [Bacteroidota bacterium]|nr:Omp28-related outer membrane protein [Bacteroidota bacterium]